MLRIFLKLRAKCPGSALILTVFIVAGMLLVASGGAYVSLLGIRAGGLQADSIKAYYAAEAGSEEWLYVLPARQDDYYEQEEPLRLLASSSPLSYEVWYYPKSLAGGTALVFRSIGAFNQTRRSIETRFGE